MYKSNYYTENQMTKYKMKADINKTWLHTLQFFTKLFAQRKAYGDNHAGNSSFDSAAHINDIPTDCSLVSTSSDVTTHDLYIESLEESLAAAWEYVAKECTPTPDKPDPANLLHIEIDTQLKQFKLIMQQNSTLQAAMARGNGGVVAAAVAAAVVAVAAVAAVEVAVTNAMTEAPRPFSQTAKKQLSMWRPIVICSQQTRTRFLSGTSPPNWTDRDRGPSIVSISMIG